MKILLLFFLLIPTSLFADHTNQHDITISCKVTVHHLGGIEDIGPIDITFNKKKLRVNWSGDVSKIIKLEKLKTGSDYSSINRIFENFKTGLKSDNYNKFIKNYTPVSFVYFAMRPYRNISKTDSVLAAVSENLKNEKSLNKGLSVIININRVEAAGAMTLRMKYKKNIYYPAVHYGDTKYFELEKYYLDLCEIKKKKF